MTTMSRRVAGLLSICVLFAASGCGVGTAAKMAYYELRGAKGSLKFIQGAEAAELERFQSVEFSPATTTIGPELCPPRLRAAYDTSAAQLKERLAECYPGGAPVLTVASDVMYFQEKGLMSGAECLTRVRFTESGRLIADALVRVESKAFRQGGASAMAETSVKTIGKFLEERKLPEHEENAEEAEED